MEEDKETLPASKRARGGGAGLRSVALPEITVMFCTGISHATVESGKLVCDKCGGLGNDRCRADAGKMLSN